MTTWLPRWIACLVLVLPFVPAIAADPDDNEIARLVQQLGSDKFKEREAASKRLAEIGEPAFDAVTKATTSKDLEVRRRAEAIVNTLRHELLRFTGHKGAVWNVSVSADSKLLLTSGEDATLRLLNADTGKSLHVFEGHTDGVRSGALSPDGKLVLSGSNDRTVRLWDATTGKELYKMTGHTESVVGVAFGPEGKALSASVEGTMRLWNLHTAKRSGIFNHSGSLDSVAYSDTAKLAATSSLGGSVDSPLESRNGQGGSQVYLPGSAAWTERLLQHL